MRLFAVLILAVTLSGCHFIGHYPPGHGKHYPPGHGKKVLKPVPPGHGGIPPGQMKKRY